MKRAMDTKFTPGPWHVHNSGKHIVTAGPTTQADTVATLHEPQGTNNAHLIAAAPGLYAALKHIVRWHDQLSAEDIAIAKAALAEAEGRAS